VSVRPSLGLAAWLAMFVLGVVVPLLVFAGVALRGVLDTSRALADRGHVDTTRALALAVDGEVRSWRAALAALAESSSIQPGRWPEFYEEARKVGLQHEGWVALTVASGEQIFNTLLPYGAPLQKTSSPETIDAIFRDGKPIVSDLIWGKNAQRYLVAVAVPVMRGGKVVNCLTLNFSPDRLTTLLLRQQLPATWVAAINDRRRLVVARSVLADARVGKPTVEWFAAATRAAESGVVTGPMIDGRLGQIAFQRLQEVPWIVALAVPVAELQSATPIWGFLTAGALLGLIAVGMAVYMGRKIAGPVRQLARASEGLLRGEASDLGPPAKIREVRDLQHGFAAASVAARAHAEEHERAAAAVAAERQRLYDVLETLPVYVVLLSADYHVPFANQFFRERFGESHGRRCFEYLFGRTEPCENCESYKALTTNAPHRWEWTGPDGRNYDIYDYPFTDSDGSRLVLEMGIDVTERKRAEAALHESHQTLERRVAERTAELESANEDLTRLNRAMVGRELRMIELKKEVNEMCGQAGRPPRYAPDVETEQG
jgi:PAS domain-containing protein